MYISPKQPAKLQGKQKIIIVDLDGTLSDSSVRQHFLQQKPKDFKSFYSELGNDKPNEWCADLVKSMEKSGTFIFYVTGRPEDYREQTMEWLKTNNLPFENTAVLFMRPSKDYRPDVQVKTEIFEREIKDKYRVLFAVDDRPTVARMWRGLGITCLQCEDKEF